MLGLYYLERILLPAAVIPAVVLLVNIYKADKREKELPELLASLVIYGVLAIFAERLGGWLLPRLMQPNTLAYQAVEYFVVVGLSEEAAKYLLLKRRTWNSPAFNYTFDGVVYAAFVSPRLRPVGKYQLRKGSATTHSGVKIKPRSTLTATDSLVIRN